MAKLTENDTTSLRNALYVMFEGLTWRTIERYVLSLESGAPTERAAIVVDAVVARLKQRIHEDSLPDTTRAHLRSG